MNLDTCIYHQLLAQVSTAQTSVQSRAPSRQQDNPLPSGSSAGGAEHQEGGSAANATNSVVSGNGPADTTSGLQPDSLEDQPREVTAENTDSEDDDTEEVSFVDTF